MKRKMNKLMSIVLVITMAYCLIACGSTAPTISEDVVVDDTEESSNVSTEVAEYSTGSTETAETEIKDGKVAETSGEEETEVTASSEPSPTVAAKPTATPESNHTHKYSETVVKQATCAEAGEKRLVCSCGDNKMEAIPATGQHNWVEEMQTITYPSMGHVEEVTAQTGTTKRTEYECAICHARFDTPSGVVDHCKEYIPTGDINHAFARTIAWDYEDPVYETVQQWVVDTPERTENVGTGRFTCSVCGTIK